MTMRAMVCHALSDTRSGLRFELHWPEPPPPGPGEATVAMRFATLNYPDLLMLSGGYRYSPPLPFIPGVEGCGAVAAVGPGVPRALIGKRVIVGARSGCFAERITVPVAGLRPVPVGLADDQAAAFTIATLTAYVALSCRGRLATGERLCCSASGGGTGSAAVAVGKALGAYVVALASTRAKLAIAEAAAADELVLVERGRSKDSSTMRAVDVVFDPVGGIMARPLLGALRRGGRYLIVGFVDGIARIPLDALLQNEVEVIGVHAGEYARRDPAAGQANLEAIDTMAVSGSLEQHIGLIVCLANVDVAFAAMSNGSLAGKVVIDCRN